jgi:hypothetical protein
MEAKEVRAGLSFGWMGHIIRVAVVLVDFFHCADGRGCKVMNT